MKSPPESRTEWVCTRLRHAVVSGEVKPGDRLISSVWSARLGVSQTPLREAYQRLVAEGLLAYDAQRGARVASLSMRELHEIYELRLKLEPEAVAASVANGDASWLHELDQAYRAFAPVAMADGPSDYLELHAAFHRSLRVSCGSSWLLRITDMLSDQSTRFAAVTLEPRGGQRATSDEHRALHEAARRRDASLAAELTHSHIKTTLDAATSAIANV